MTNYSSPLRILQTDFRAGQVSPRLAMRVDSKVYPSGARTLRNCLLRSTGPVDRRPGTTRLVQLNQRSRLIDFEFDDDEAYVFAFGNNHLRIYDPSGTALQTFTGSTDCPWDATTAWEITVTQLADVMLIAHGDFATKKLTRTGSTTFTIEDYAFDEDTSGLRVNQPHIKYEPPTTRVSISNTAVGTGRTLTSSPGIFSAAWVGKRLRIFDCEIEITGYTNSTTCTATVHQQVRAKLDPNPIRSNDASTLVEVTHALHGLSTGDTVTMQGIDVTATSIDMASANLNITTTITVIDEDHYTYNAAASDIAARAMDFGGTSVYVVTTALTRAWTEQAFSSDRGYPSAVCFHQDRLWFGGCDEAPTLLVGSVVGAYYDFDVGDGEDDASVQATLSTARFGRIRHILSASQLCVFTETSEIICETANGEPITPGNLRIGADTTYGIGDVAPAVFDGAPIFVQKNGKSLREISYDYQSEAFTAPMMSAAASNLMLDPHDMAVVYGSTTRPEQYALLVNSDGTISCFHSVRNEDLAAWTPFATFGTHEFDSVCVLGTTVYFSIKVGSNYWLNRWELDEEDIWLDNAKEMTAAATTTWALGSSYANETVSVMSNGHYIGDYTANGSGTITLTEAVTDIVAGYDYGISIVPLPPDREIADGPLTGEIRRIVSVTAHFHETVNAVINGQEVVGLSIGDDLSEPPVEFSGKKRVRLLGYDRDPAIEITQNSPGKMTVLGFTQEVSF